MVTPDHLRGRMTAVNMVFFMGGPQLGEFEAGVVAKYFGAPLVGHVGRDCLPPTVAWIGMKAQTLRDYRGETSAASA